jgi:hypothetical protein
MKKEKKTERIMIRLTKTEKENLEKILEIQDKKLATVLRQYIDDYIKAYIMLINATKGDSNNE